MKKYSVVFNCLPDNTYALVCKSWELNEEGNETNVVALTKVSLTLEEVLTEMNNFLSNAN